MTDQPSVPTKSKAKKKAKELDEKHKIVASTKKLVNNAAEKSKQIDEELMTKCLSCAVRLKR